MLDLKPVFRISHVTSWGFPGGSVVTNLPANIGWAFHLRNLYSSQEATLEQDMEQQTGSKMGKEYVKAVYWHPAI